MIIAFGHQKQVGKDTAVDAIYASSMRADKYSLAGPLYQICEILDSNFRSKEYYDKAPANKSLPLPGGKTPREFLIEVGENLKEVCGKHCWVDMAINYSKVMSHKHLLISDIRYKEEAERLKQHGAIFVKVVRPDLPHTSDKADDDLLDWDGWDVCLVNNCSIEKFREKAVNLYEELTK